ncbi:MATH and LRR domain-containing protein PFE0570w-like [Microplitis mediator]|uniref:MATH and LRR domain-containing protein PFE0570w-like n=1 Tax=Microplitis mediator TaxID=375433 RepID=UPI002554C571|nr:MATH and LRR domain-containing protein PFE0570w-like [Microplitis mediator]
MFITSSRVCQDHLSTPYSITSTSNSYKFKMNKKLFTVKIICFLITIFIFSSVASGDDDKSNNNFNEFKRKKKQLSTLSSPLLMKLKNDRYIELKDPPILRVTPISLFDLDYKSSQEELYEEMDELLKLKRKLNSEDENYKNKNFNIKRGDMDPTVDYSVVLEDKIDDKVPVRGDIVTRNKRSHHQYHNNKNNDDYEYYGDNYDNDQLWGFDEDDGIDLIDQEYNDNYYQDNKNDNNFVNEFKNKVTSLESNKKININNNRQEELEKKLQDYIARNRPIVINNRKNNKDNYQEMIKKLNEIPVSARIIIDKNKNSLSSPSFETRNNFERDVDFPVINPNRKGIQVPNFPVVSSRPLSSSSISAQPGPCIWAIVQCCPSLSSSSTSKDNVVDHRVIKCFEYMACPGVVNWNNPSPCQGSIANAARAEVLKYYSYRS